MYQSKYMKISLGLLMSMLLIACGGTSGSDNTEAIATPIPTTIPTVEPRTQAMIVPTVQPTVTPTVQPTIVPNLIPIADAGVDQNVSFGTSIVIDAVKSVDSDGKIMEYSWSDGTEVIGKEPSIVIDNLTKEGTYKYTLTVKDDQNATSSDSIEIRTYSDSVVRFETNQGDIFLKMMTNIAPKAVENFMTHSKNGYYNDVIFHRVIKDFMIQGGDPTGTGRGGKSIWGGYFANEIDSNVLFDRPFILAMANAGGTTTNGSQFFITTKEGSFLNGKYTIFGEVLEGTETVSKIENVKTGSADKPKEDQTILNASIYFEIK